MLPFMNETPSPTPTSASATASSSSQWAHARRQPRAPDRSEHERQIKVGTAAFTQPRDRFQWTLALPGFHRKHQIAVGTAGPQVRAFAVEARQYQCQREWQNRCQIECQMECQNRCQKVCQNRCEKECQNECQIEWQNQMSERMPDRMPE